MEETGSTPKKQGIGGCAAALAPLVADGCNDVPTTDGEKSILQHTQLQLRKISWTTERSPKDGFGGC